MTTYAAQPSGASPEEFEEDEVYVFPSSFAQQRLWFLDQLEPGSPFYNIPTAFRLKGKLEVRTLEKALNEIIRRHETLRTTFIDQDGQPAQVITPRGSITLPVIDLQQVPEGERAAEAQRLANQEARLPFNLSTGPLFRASLLRMGPEEHIILITMHHIISDGWSVNVLANEISVLYWAFSHSKPSPLPELEIQYADFAHWQRQYLSGKVLEEQLNYWKEQLGGNLPVLELSADRPRPAAQSFRGGNYDLHIPKSIADGLKLFSQREGVTLFMTLLAAFNVLLYRHSGQEDITVGSPIANRTRAEIEPLIGFFVNTLVLRTDLSGEPTFRDLLKRIKETTLGAYSHQDLPFEAIVDALHPERDMSYNPLFQVMFILQNVSSKAEALEGLSLSMVDQETGTSTFDLTLTMAESVDGMIASFEYATDLFDATTVERLMKHYQVLLQSIIQTPDELISKLPILTEEERRQLLADWNSDYHPFPGLNKVMPQLFEARAAGTPDAVAVVWPTTDLKPENAQKITYGELNRKANQLASYLRRLGVQPETPVGIILERSLDIPVAVMGVLKSGGAYLPIDPTYPVDRMEYMLQDSGVPILIAQQRLIENLPEYHGRVICIDTGWDEIAKESAENLECVSKPEQLAYLIYTSGSTGKPKGTMVRHLGLVNNYFAWEDSYDLKNARSHLQMANFAFDVFSADFTRSLCSGGKLVLCPREFLLVPQQLYALMLQEEIEIAEFVPAVLRSLVQYLDKSGQDLSFMKLLICGSDIWYVGEYKDFLRYLGPQTRLINSFGLTEATIDSSFYEARDLNLPSDQHVPIGRPFANTPMYVLDKYLQPLPIGVHGELFVGGPCVARGYLNRPDLTAEKFIRNPYWEMTGIKILGGEMLYKTGDMARFLPDGNIEFLGRMDYQVKIRGFRIEVGEIESVLRNHPAVRDAVVIASQVPPANGSGPGQSRLAAYLVADLNIDRVPLHSKVTVLENGNGNSPSPDEAPIQVATADLSYGGLCLVNVPKSWQEGQSLHIRLPLPGVPEVLDTHAVVQWKVGNDAGLMLKVNPTQQAMLRQSIKHISENGDTTLTDLRRMDPRVPLRSACTVEFPDGTVRELTMENLSRGGMRLLGEKGLFNKGDSVRLRLNLPETGQTPWLQGVVWWQNEERAGIKFDINPSERKMIEETVESILHSEGFSLAHLRAFLKSKLPDYMVPSAFVMLDNLPLTHNGKVDRKALPAPDWSSRDWEEEFIAPRTPVEEMLAGVWTQILGVEKIGAFDNFFELGGHSLLATQLVSRVRDAFQVDLPLRAIFESPVLASLAEQIEVTQRSSAGLPVQNIQPVSRSQDLPLSFAQQRLWFMDQYEPESPFYNLFDAVRIHGSLDVSVLERCLNEIIRRHEVLRTTFITVDGKPRQEIHPALEISIPVSDVTHLPEAEREAEALRLANQEVQIPFNLARLPLLRARLVKLGADDHMVLLTMHHIIGDDWSSRVLTGEISMLYPAFASGQPSPLPDLAIQYADFSAWQRGWLQGETLEAQIGYWKKELSGLPPLLELPIDRPRPAVQSFQGEYTTFSISPKASRAIRNLTQREGATLFMTLMAAFQTLLYRYSNQEEFAVGTVIANRNRADIESLIGFFVNTLVIRGDVSRQPTFRQLLKRVRESSLGAYAHQDLPFETLVDELQPERKLSHNPLFQVMFVLQNAPGQGQEMTGLSFAPVDLHSGTSKFDLTLFMIDEGEQLSGAFEYSTDLFDPETIERMISAFQTLLESIAANPDELVASLPILSPEEYSRIVYEWNATETEFPRHLCAHQLIEAQVDRTPDALAVTFRDRKLTYAELEQRANQLAHFLQPLGVGPDSLVGVCIPRSPEMVTAILAVLKAGGAYVPMDPSSPPERLAYILQDASAPVLLTMKTQAAELAPFMAPESQTRVICVDSDWEAVAKMSTERLDCSATPENLAYVIYTSGSTGKPKGAEILHRGLVNYLTWVEKAYPLQQGEGAPVQSSISFDLTVTSLYAPLLSGGHVALVDEELGVEALGELLKQEGHFSLVKITPAHLKLLGEQISPEMAASRTQSFIIGGENLLVDHVAFWQKYAPEAALVNEYGPTETVVGCCVYWTPLNKHQSGVIPIGKPIINTKLYILDAQQQPVPVGVHGELYIGGEGVARGYHNRPDLTAEKFLLDPFSKEPGARMYRTGDLVRYLPDGNIECLGRIDFQVKIRGFRVELGEIEAVLGQHPAAKEVVVWVHEDGAIKRLVAYMVPADPSVTPASSELREFLREKLPEYMIPAAFVWLEVMPLSSSGKVDRKALPAPDFSRPELQSSYEAPTSEKEEILVGIWKQVLGVEQVGIHDNFFELGGDSILSIQVVARANQAGVNFTPRQLFEFPTIAELAAVAGTKAAIQAEQGLVSGLVSLTPIQRWFFDLDLNDSHHWNQSIMLQVGQPLARPALEETIAALFRHHDILRMRFDRAEGGWQAVIDEQVDTLPLVWVDLSSTPAEEQSAAVEREAARLQSSLDLTRSPLGRIAYFDLGPDQPARLFMAFHHLLMDGLSWRILIEDFLAIYQAASAGVQPVLPPKTTSYQYWAKKLEEYAGSEEVQKELDYWLETASAGSQPLPVDFPEGENFEGGTATVTSVLSEEETQSLLQEVHSAYRTEINDLLLAALSMAFNQWTGDSSLVVELEGHGREDLFDDVDISRTLGWFTALYPVRLPGCGPDLAETIKSTKEALRRVPNHGIGYGVLRFLSENPEIQARLNAAAHPGVTFNYLGQIGGTLQENNLVGFARESTGPERSPSARRTSLIDINGGITGGQLQMEWTYNTQVHRPETIEKLAADYTAALQRLIQHCLAPDSGGYTSSDFEEFGWNDDDLADILGEIEDHEKDNN